MSNLKKNVLAVLCVLAFPGLGLAAGTGNHSHGQPQASTCTPEHEAMGHCKMDDSHGHVASTVGSPAPAGTVPSRSITVHMTDNMRFNFSEPPLAKAGETIRFVVMNKGKIAHEFGIGSVAEQNAHRDMMRKMPDMKHEDGQTITVEPGATKELVWQFAGNGVAQYACSVPGHFEAGMHHEITIQ